MSTIIMSAAWCTTNILINKEYILRAQRVSKCQRCRKVILDLVPKLLTQSQDKKSRELDVAAEFPSPIADLVRLVQVFWSRGDTYQPIALGRAIFIHTVHT